MQIIKKLKRKLIQAYLFIYNMCEIRVDSGSYKLKSKTIEKIFRY